VAETQVAVVMVVRQVVEVAAVTVVGVEANDWLINEASRV